MKKAMTVDVSSILKELGGKLEVCGEVTLPDTEFLGEYRFYEPLKVEGNISNNGKALRLNARVTGQMTTNCARCTKEITVPVDFEMAENLMQGEGEAIVDEDVILFKDTAIELDDIVLDNFLMNLEGKYLCSEDCKGLCPTCGADLNKGECGCSKENIDPRWSQLLDIMKNNEN